MERTLEYEAYCNVRFIPTYLLGGMVVRFLTDIGHQVSHVEILSRLEAAVDDFTRRFAFPHQIVPAAVLDLSH